MNFEEHNGSTVLNDHLNTTRDATGEIFSLAVRYQPQMPLIKP